MSAYEDLQLIRQREQAAESTADGSNAGGSPGAGSDATPSVPPVPPVAPVYSGGVGETDGAHLLDQVLATVQKYVVLPSQETATAVTLWIGATHATPHLAAAPRLAVLSPEKRCGKSRLLDMLVELCHDPLVAANASTAAVFRSLGKDHPPTLILDEADSIFGTKQAAESHEDLRGLLNAGFERGRPILRCVGPNQSVGKFQVFAMAAIAAIGTLPDTITDRAVVVSMRRRAPGEAV